jgi:hypothetical protein
MGKTIVALARLYKGVLIFRTPSEYVIFNVIGERIPFVSEASAEAYVDGFTAETFSAN